MSAKSFHKDLLRTLAKSKMRFLSILAITALGVGFFAGIKATEPDMILSADAYYQKQNLSDFRVLAPMGFRPQDLESIASLPGIDQIQPGYIMDFFLYSESGNRYSIRLYSHDPRLNEQADALNRLTVEQGRLPAKPGEMLLEAGSNIPENIAVNSIITLGIGENRNITDYLARDTFTVVGRVQSPLYISFDRGQTSIGDGSIDFYAYICVSDFIMERFSEVYLRTTSSSHLTAYTDEYTEHISGIERKLLDLSDEWIVMTRDHQPGYTEYGDDARRIGAVATIFPLFFLLVAALVCLTTMTRMIEEERVQIGTLKAIGYNTLSISSKYLVYALSASLAGSAIGLLIGFQLFPGSIMNAYAIMYQIPDRLTPFHLDIAALSVLIAALATVLVALLATLRELKSTPAVLMQPRAPRPGKRIFLEYIKPLWSRLSFMQKLTARNLFRYKQRLFMTIIGIAGCTALLLTGFGMKDSVNAIIGQQFDEIFIYDGLLMIDPEKDSEKKAIETILENTQRIESYMPLMSDTVTALAAASNLSYSVTIIVPQDLELLPEFYQLRDRQSGEALLLPATGAVITEKLAELTGIGEGDSISLRDAENRTFTVEVSSIAENYLTHYIYMSPEYFNQITYRQPIFNAAVFHLGDTDQFDAREFQEYLLDHDAVLGSMLTLNLSADFAKSVESLNYIVIILILSAGALAFVVLYNLTSINISERIREIATIKVLGFRDREVSQYVFRENILLTLFGIVAGLILGFYLHRFVMGTMETDAMMFGRQIHWLSYLLSVFLTMGFAVLVNIFMFYHLRKIKLVESLKSVE